MEELSRARGVRSGVPWVIKFGYLYIVVFFTVQYNGTDKNSFFAGTEQRTGSGLGGIVGSLVG